MANLVLVGVGAVVVATGSPLVGAAVAGIGVTAVWLRGYVVPGTPTLTRRYFPDRVLTWFGKPPGGTASSVDDPTEQLSALGVLRTDEPRLSSAFRERWGDNAAAIAGDERAIQRAAGEVLFAPPADVDVDATETGIELTVSGDWVGQWPSRAALIADLATELALADSDWAGLPRPTRADLAARVRGLAERCPICETSTRVSEDTVESCCSSADVVAVTCPECAARLAEFDPTPAAFAPGQ